MWIEYCLGSTRRYHIYTYIYMYLYICHHHAFRHVRRLWGRPLSCRIGLWGRPSLSKLRSDCRNKVRCWGALCRDRNKNHTCKTVLKHIASEHNTALHMKNRICIYTYIHMYMYIYIYTHVNTYIYIILSSRQKNNVDWAPEQNFGAALNATRISKGDAI